MLDLVLSLVMLAALALLGGAWLLWRRGLKRQASLMLVLAVVMLANLAIWSLPDRSGRAPADLAREAAPAG